VNLNHRDLMSYSPDEWMRPNRAPPEPGSPEAEREKRALEVHMRQLEQRVKLIEARLEVLERGERDAAS
jgi:hypothetical protein